MPRIKAFCSVEHLLAEFIVQLLETVIFINFPFSSKHLVATIIQNKEGCEKLVLDWH